MKNLTLNIYDDNRFVGKINPSFEKYDSYSNILTVYDVKSNSYNNFKVTIELLKPKKIEKFTTNRTCSELDFKLIDKINEIIDYINKGE